MKFNRLEGKVFEHSAKFFVSGVLGGTILGYYDAAHIFDPERNISKMSELEKFGYAAGVAFTCLNFPLIRRIASSIPLIRRIIIYDKEDMIKYKNMATAAPAGAMGIYVGFYVGNCLRSL